MLPDRLKKILKRLGQLYPKPLYYLNFSNPLELMVGVILSAQARDEMVNKITPALFSRFKTPQDYANAGPGEIKKMIRSISYPNNKARHIHGACRALIEQFQSQMPSTMENLLQLPGIGRKSANVLLINSFNKTEGIVVDTHVIRLARRLGMTQEQDPQKIERDLKKILPKSHWVKITWFFKEHGRALCVAQKPRCAKCPLFNLCPKQGVVSSSEFRVKKY